MSKNARRALFYGFFFAFIVLGTVIVLFAQGWRIDLPSLRISKVGGIYVRSYPDNADIFLNGKSVQNQSGFLSPGTLISDLFPKTYLLALTAPGYRDWHENVAVHPALVANHKDAVLVPANENIAASGTVAQFLATPNGPIIETTSHVLSLNGTVIGHGTITAIASDASSMTFRTPQGNYEFAPLPDGQTTDLSTILAKMGFDPSNPSLIIRPLSNGMVFAVTQKRAAVINIARANGTLLATTPRETAPPIVANTSRLVAWTYASNASGSSTIFFYDPSSGTVSTTSIAIQGPVKKLGWISDNLLGILTDNGTLYLDHTDQETLQKLADDVRSFSATADGSRIATVESRSLEIFTPNDPEGYYRFNLPNIDSAQTAVWYRDNDHLFILYPDSVAFLDLQDASISNFTTVATGTSAAYDPSGNSLYLIDPTNHLIQFDFPK